MPLVVPPGQELPKVPEFEPVLTFKSRIVYMKDVPSGTPLGYSAAFYTRRPSRIATVPVGYADGLSHALSNRGYAIVRGRRARIVGSISMDFRCSTSPTSPGTNIGDEVILMGQADHSSITACGDCATAGHRPLRGPLLHWQASAADLCRLSRAETSLLNVTNVIRGFFVVCGKRASPHFSPDR